MKTKKYSRLKEIDEIRDKLGSALKKIYKLEKEIEIILDETKYYICVYCKEPIFEYDSDVCSSDKYHDPIHEKCRDRHEGKPKECNLDIRRHF